MLTVDSNVPIYAWDVREPTRAAIARDLLSRLMQVETFLTQQVIGEFCNVTLRKRLLTAARIDDQVSDWKRTFHIVPTRATQLLEAVYLAERRRKQFWDMVLVQVAADAGASVLFSEDIGDGETIAGVRIINPFDPGNNELVAAALAA